jgi:hypothetical protein
MTVLSITLLERVKQLVEGGANIEEPDDEGMTALSLASARGHLEFIVYLVEHGANVAHTDIHGMTALHLACFWGYLPIVKYLLEQRATITDSDNSGTTAFPQAAEGGSLDVVQFLLSSEGGASISETDDLGNSALLLAGMSDCPTRMVQWLLEHGGAQFTDTNNEGNSVWTVRRYHGLPALLRCAYTKGDDGKYVTVDGEYVPADPVDPHDPDGSWRDPDDIRTITAVLRAMVLHGGPPESLAQDLAPPLRQIVHDGARLRARLPAYLTQRRALLDAHCPLLPPLLALVHGYEVPATTDELWATGLGAPLQRAKRSRPERGQSPERRSSAPAPEAPVTLFPASAMQRWR